MTLRHFAVAIITAWLCKFTLQIVFCGQLWLFELLEMLLVAASRWNSRIQLACIHFWSVKLSGADCSGRTA